MSKTWCSIKEIKLCFQCEILILKDTVQGQKTLTNLFDHSWSSNEN